MIKIFAKRKPNRADAVLWTGRNTQDVKNWLKDYGVEVSTFEKDGHQHLTPHNLQARLTSAHVGDYIIRTEKGAVYPLTAQQFNERFEQIGMLQG